MTRRFRRPGRLSRLGAAAFLVAAALAAPAPALARAGSALDRAALTAILEETRAEMKMPGLRAAVRFRDGRIVRAAVGLADREARIPLDDSVRMPGGSTGKTFVAALTMLLVEDGVLSLDDPASKWLGDRDWYRRLPNADAIRVRHLLSHSAGLGDYPGTMRFRVRMVWRAIRRGGRFEPEELIGFIGRKPLYPAGRGYAYTDAGYLVLGRVIEAAAGRPYYDQLRERILEPHNLGGIGLQDRSVLPDITPGYTMGARNLRKDGTMKFDPSSEWTGGGLTTNPTMLVQFHGALAEGRIVRPESLAAMLESGWRNPATPDRHYGFGLFVYDGGASFGHGGLWPGYRTHVRHYAESGITVAVQTNRDGRLDMQAVVERIVSWLGQDERPPTAPGDMIRNARLPAAHPAPTLSGDRP